MDESIATDIARECGELREENRKLKAEQESSRSPGLLTANGKPVTREMLEELWALIKSSCGTQVSCVEESKIAAAKRLVEYGSS